ncbi:hypothetical protein [Varunaivibrio sulfuroxidans]|uniref:DsrE/DsrF/DsrH-like protein n=1 Tax=Varunaivibrio sulfuroxidans TaxID=1773489 RepID=A0A4V2UN46_9PROT|nr:hypothetical protein [Varunaivibrio sulfuroxidans]TCS60601.1 hypothetical protein EDD55_11076 [Varunaivibrio sulfuroxidans]WES30091.1 hypothetical protein P3M64_10645 [Varunaivibrio sulfuroxidans]
MTENTLDVLLHITTAKSAAVAAPLGRALSAAGIRWACFLTNDGVMGADDAAFADALEGAQRVAVCEHSWDIHMKDPHAKVRSCPFERASQTVNSALMGEAGRVVAL